MRIRWYAIKEEHLRSFVCLNVPQVLLFYRFHKKITITVVCINDRVKIAILVFIDIFKYGYKSNINSHTSKPIFRKLVTIIWRSKWQVTERVLTKPKFLFFLHKIGIISSLLGKSWSLLQTKSCKFNKMTFIAIIVEFNFLGFVFIRRFFFRALFECWKHLHVLAKVYPCVCVYSCMCVCLCVWLFEWGRLGLIVY